MRKCDPDVHRREPRRVVLVVDRICPYISTSEHPPSTMRPRSYTSALSILFFGMLLCPVAPVRASASIQLTLSGITYADEGTASGYITVSYADAGSCAVDAFDITLTSAQLVAAYGTPSITMSGTTGAAPTGWQSYIAGPIENSNIYQLGVCGAPTEGGTQLNFWFDVPESLIIGPAPLGTIEFDTTAEGYGGAWLILQRGAPQSFLTGGALESVAVPEPSSSILMVPAFIAFLGVFLRRSRARRNT